MQSFESLMAYWKSVSADWKPFSPEDQPCVLSLHDDQQRRRSRRSTETHRVKESREEGLSYGRGGAGPSSGSINLLLGAPLGKVMRAQSHGEDCCPPLGQLAKLGRLCSPLHRQSRSPAREHP
jgi:hypothetical protein